MYIFPVLLMDIIGLKGVLVECRGFAWACGAGVLSTGCLLLISAAWSVFPVPLSSVICGIASGAALPFLYWLPPKNLLNTPLVARRMIVGVIGLLGIHVRSPIRLVKPQPIRSIVK